VVEDPTARFAALVRRQDRPLPVDEALLLVAAHADPSLDLPAELGRLDDIAALVEEPTVEAVLDTVYGRLGFSGDRETYYAADNSLLPRVLDRRKGIPLSLALLLIEVGRRCGVALEGIGMPGHYLLRPVGQPERFLDAFDGGRSLDVEGCHALFERSDAVGMPWEAAYLRPDAPWARVTRTLGNLAGSYRRAGDRDELIWVLQLALLLPSGSMLERRELVVLLSAAGRFDEAAAVLEATGAEEDAEEALRFRARLN
jgi:regulator of sirC expression with transglutaminase-like and TPR domain